MSDKIIFQSKSRFSSLSLYLGLLFGGGATIYLLFHYSENPTLITLIIAVLVLVTFGRSREVIVVKEDQFEIKYDRVLSIFSTSKKFSFEEIKEIEADLPLTQSSKNLSNLLTATTPFMMIVMSKLVITYTDGRVKKLATGIYRDAFHEAFRYIGKLSKINIIVNDIQ